MEHNGLFPSRRRFIRNLSSTLAGATIGIQGILTITGCKDENEKNPASENEATMNGNDTKKLGIALVGLGKYSKGQLAPALKETSQCYLAGIVTGSPEKIDEWKKDYSIPDKNVYNYSSFDNIKDNPDIDIVYVVLPNAMHAEYVIRAARAGKHVICEKPMAVMPEDCDRMIAACKEAGKMLSVGYRLHFEPHTREMIRLTKEKKYGELKKLTATNGMNGTEGWRLDKELSGGGPLMDVGIYCVQAARYATGMEPIAVSAKEGSKTKPDMFKEIEESLSWRMEFPGGLIAECETSYSEEMNVLRVDAEKGWYELSPAYGYGGIKGETADGKINFPEVNQQALQMDDFAEAIMNNRPTPVPGEMGKQDVKILQAIYKAMKTGKRVEIA